MKKKIFSPLEKKRLEYVPPLPDFLKDLTHLSLREKTVSFPAEAETVKPFFSKTFGTPILEFVKEKNKNASQKTLKVGVVFSGGPAAGGHNVITGLFDALTTLNPKSSLLGFLDGPKGILENRFTNFSEQLLSSYRNQGGFDLIGSGRTKIETEEQMQQAEKTVRSHALDGLVIIGGDDSNTNAALLAEFFLKNQCPTKVIGVPKTIDGDLKNDWIETSFGFDTACKVYSELIGNLSRDALSSKKYYHFIKLMGRSASHIALECALSTRPNVTLIGEEIFEKQMTLKETTSSLADVICKRQEMGKTYGVILIPEGVIEFIPEVKVLIQELNDLLAKNKEQKVDPSAIEKALSPTSRSCFLSLPETIQKQLFLDRDPHGNVLVSQIATETLFIETVKKELKKRGKENSFNPLSHFFGYEGRCGLPSNFDANYCYTLGYVAAFLIDQGKTGYMTCLTHLKEDTQKWKAFGIPFTLLLNQEKRKGKLKPVIKKALVDLNKKPFLTFAAQRTEWQLNDLYQHPGPIQFFGDPSLTDAVAISLTLS